MRHIRNIPQFLFLLLFFVSPAAAQHFTDWEHATNPGVPVNTVFADTHPSISRDGLSLYFNADRNRGGSGLRDLWVAKRMSNDGPWITAENLGPVVNSAYQDENPAISADGHFLFFGSDRPSPCGWGGFDIWVSWREHTHDDSGWQTPVNLGCDVNSAADETSPGFWLDDEDGAVYLYFARQVGTAAASNLDIYVSTLRADGTFGPAAAVAALNTSVEEDGPALSHNGLDLYFSRQIRVGTLANGKPMYRADIFVSRRESTTSEWLQPEPLNSDVNTLTSAEVGPSISWDGATLYFGASFRAGNTGGDLYDIWSVTRTKVRGPY